jgi:hypothetical protein
MASKANLDVAEKLDITCRKGDTFELSLNFKDSAGVAIPLVTNSYPSVSRGRLAPVLPLKFRGSSNVSPFLQVISSFSATSKFALLAIL